MSTIPAPEAGQRQHVVDDQHRGGLPRASSTCGRIVDGSGPSGPPPGGRDSWPASSADHLSWIRAMLRANSQCLKCVVVLDDSWCRICERPS
jgi:hypothetical protein